MTPAQAGRVPYRADIDGLRAISIAVVVVFHAFPSALPGGFVGVDVFFVISGYLITSLIRDAEGAGAFSFVEFYRRRARRLFPALGVVLLVVLAFGWHVLLAEEYAQLGKHAAASAAFITNLALLSESGYFDNAAETKPLLHLWSLGIEEQFYLAWPLLLVGLSRLGRGVAGTTIALALASFVAGIWIVGSDPAHAFFSPATRAWELLAGALIALHRDRLSGQGTSVFTQVAAVACLAAIFGASAMFHGGLAFPGAWALVPTTAAAVLVAAGPETWAARRVLSRPVLVYLGRISYALYLWHWPLFSFARILLGRPTRLVEGIVLLLGSLALAALTYELAERPIRFGRWRRGGLAAACVAVLVAGLAGLWVYRGEGWPGRPAAHVSPSVDPAIRRYASLANGSRSLEYLKSDRQNAIRAPRCHMNREGETLASYLPTFVDCLRPSPTKPNVLVLGDSHAADLYVALKHVYGSSHHFLQATGAGCSPEHSVAGTSPCAEMHRYAVAHARRSRVPTIVLAARWSHLRPVQLHALIRELQAFSKVYLVGPPASFSADVSKLVARGGVDRTQASISARYLDEAVLRENRRLAAIARETEVVYVDRIAAQCGTERNCSLLAADGSLLIFDYGHLTRRGGEDLGDRLYRGGLRFP